MNDGVGVGGGIAVVNCWEGKGDVPARRGRADVGRVELGGGLKEALARRS